MQSVLMLCTHCNVQHLSPIPPPPRTLDKLLEYINTHYGHGCRLAPNGIANLVKETLNCVDTKMLIWTLEQDGLALVELYNLPTIAPYLRELKLILDFTIQNELIRAKALDHQVDFTDYLEYKEQHSHAIAMLYNLDPPAEPKDAEEDDEFEWGSHAGSIAQADIPVAQPLPIRKCSSTNGHTSSLPGNISKCGRRKKPKQNG